MSGRFLTALLFLLSLVSLAGCKQASPVERNHDADVRAIQEAEAQWNDDYTSRNISRLMAHYAEDAVLMMPGQPPSAGPAAIRRSIEQMLSDPALALNFETAKVEVATSGDLAYTQGSYTLTATDPRTKQPIKDHGSYVTTYRKQADGAWKAVADIATSAVPAVAAPEPTPASESVPNRK